MAGDRFPGNALMAEAATIASVNATEASKQTSKQADTTTHVVALEAVQLLLHGGKKKEAMSAILVLQADAARREAMVEARQN
jgi:hypothetical protein